MFRFVLLVSVVFAVGICGRQSHGSGEEEGRGPRPGPGRGPPPPPYLRNVTEEATKEYFDIVKSQNEAISAQKQKVQEWAQKYGVLDQVNEFEANMTKFKTETNKNVTDLIAQLAQGQQQLSQIFENENQTREEQHQAIEAFRNQSRSVFDTLMFIGSQFRPRGPHGPGGDLGGRGGKGGPGGQGGHGGKGFKGDQKQGRSQGGRGGF